MSRNVLLHLHGNVCTIAVEFLTHYLAQGPIALFPRQLFPRAIDWTLFATTASRALASPHDSLQLRAVFAGHVPLVIDQLAAKVLFQTDQGAFSVHPSPHRTRQFQESLQVHEDLTVCIHNLGRQSEAQPVAHASQQLNSCCARWLSTTPANVTSRMTRIRISRWS